VDYLYDDTYQLTREHRQDSSNDTLYYNTFVYGARELKAYEYQIALLESYLDQHRIKCCADNGVPFLSYFARRYKGWETRPRLPGSGT